jgi:Phosphodiester glycosidase
VQRSVRPGPDGWTGPEGRGAPYYYWDPADPPTDPGYRSGPDYDWDPADPPIDPRYRGAQDGEDWNLADPAIDPRYRGAQDDEDWNPAGTVTDPRYAGGPDYDRDPAGTATDPRYAGGPDYDRDPAGTATDPRYPGGPDYDRDPAGTAIDPRYPGGPDYDRDPAGTAIDPRYPGGPDYDRDPAGTAIDPRYRGAQDDEDWNLADPAIDPRYRGAQDDEDWNLADPEIDPRYRGAPDHDRDPGEPTDPQPSGRPPGGLPPGGRRRRRQPGGPPPRGRRRRGRQPGARKRRPLRQRMWVRITLGLLATFLVIVAWSVGNALTVPGGGTVSDRLAEWARDHYLGPVVTFGEWLTYQAPKVGGKPSFALSEPGAAPATTPAKPRAVQSFGPPAPLQSLAGKPLPGEGQWRVLAAVHGTPAIYGTYLRASSVYSSYVAGIASMNQSLVRFELRPGSEDPGPGNWKALPYIAPGTRLGLLATFNSGFKIAQSGGGFYLNGAIDGTLTKGVASVVYYQDGHISIGVWGQSVRMTPDVVGVRQNLHLIVENGTIPASVDSNVESSWGATLGGGYYVWRSGIGITQDGRVIFVYGPALNVRELAQLLKRAGAVTAMQLDINPEWMSYMYYLPKHHPANPTPVAMLPNQMQAANRYYSITGRDFTAVYAR